MRLHEQEIEAYLSNYLGSCVQVLEIRQLGGESSGAAALKAFGYGQPLRVDYRYRADNATDAARGRVVVRRVSRNSFGHERDSDRVSEIWLDYQTFNSLPNHVGARDMVGLTTDGRLTSVGDICELLLLTEYAPGTPYADDLLRIRDEGRETALDRTRAQLLGRYLGEIHLQRHHDPLLWRRRLRDLVGGGEGIMGIAESYPADFTLAKSADFRLIEDAANRWRWRLMAHEHRLCQVHGDFHPYNILFGDGEEFLLLDRSRGEWGEAADDVSCLVINYLFFSLQRYGVLSGPFLRLYELFLQAYLSMHADGELNEVIQPWFAWRALVLANPMWYPTLPTEVRRQLIAFARRIMAAEYFEWRRINDYLPEQEAVKADLLSG